MIFIVPQVMVCLAVYEFSAEFTACQNLSCDISAHSRLRAWPEWEPNHKARKE